MNQVIDTTGTVSPIRTVIPEVVNAEVVVETPIQLNPDERQDAPRPEWMHQIVRRQFRLAKKYKKARNLALEIYNIAIEEFENSKVVK